MWKASRRFRKLDVVYVRFGFRHEITLLCLENVLFSVEKQFSLVCAIGYKICIHVCSHIYTYIVRNVYILYIVCRMRLGWVFHYALENFMFIYKTGLNNRMCIRFLIVYDICNVLVLCTCIRIVQTECMTWNSSNRETKYLLACMCVCQGRFSLNIFQKI